MNYHKIREIYSQFLKAFGSCILPFEEFLTNEYDEIFSNFNERSSFELKLLQKSTWTKAYQDYFFQIFSQYVEVVKFLQCDPFLSVQEEKPRNPG